MGVRGLMPLLARFAPRAISMPDAKDLRGLALAVDSNIFVHRFLKGTDGGSDDKRHLRGMQRLVAHARALDTTLLFVFDGEAPASGKEAELEKRQAERARTKRELDAEKARAQRIGSMAAISARLLSDDAVGDMPSEERVVTWLEGLADAAAGSGRADQPEAPAATISGRMDQLEAAACGELLAMLGRREEPPPVPGGRALATLQALSAERLAVLGRRTEPLTGGKLGECVELVAALGCATHVTAAGEESEGVCAELCRAGVVDAVCSEDLDVVAHDARLLRGFGAGAGAHASMALVDGQRARAELGLSRAAFVDLCILCGTDFSSTLERVGPITALQLVREHGSIERILERCPLRPRPRFAPATARAVFLPAARPPPIASRRALELLAPPADPAAAAELLGAPRSRALADGADPFAAGAVLL